jgi:hypothetical protein
MKSLADLPRKSRKAASRAPTGVPFVPGQFAQDEDGVTYTVVGLSGDIRHLREWRGGRAAGDILSRHYKSLRPADHLDGSGEMV